ncbi:hypothetical protein BTVI_142208 [Pitangus sulphuratus]|nr:hypothetical protein BTVI_142208 [Pitangus sulphuratus]
MFRRLKFGLMLFRPVELHNIYNCRTGKDSSHACRISCICTKGNYLLCLLLLGNMLTNTTLTILILHLTVSIIGAMVASTIGILLLGEIIHHALCSQHCLAMGANTIMVTKFFMLLMLPQSYPIGKLLDCLLCQEKLIWYNQEKLFEMLKMTEPYNNLVKEELNTI